MDMIVVPKGSIAMRDDRINPRWSAEVRSFAMARYPVTHMQYATFVAHSYPPEKRDAPVENVSWLDAARSCMAMNRRRSHPTFAINDVGFRVARSLKDASNGI